MARPAHRDWRKGQTVYVDSRNDEDKQANGVIEHIDFESEEIVVRFNKGTQPGQLSGGDKASYSFDDFELCRCEKFNTDWYII